MGRPADISRENGVLCCQQQKCGNSGLTDLRQGPRLPVARNFATS